MSELNELEGRINAVKGELKAYAANLFQCVSQVDESFRNDPNEVAFRRLTQEFFDAFSRFQRSDQYNPNKEQFRIDTLKVVTSAKKLFDTLYNSTEQLPDDAKACLKQLGQLPSNLQESVEKLFSLYGYKDMASILGIDKINNTIKTIGNRVAHLDEPYEKKLNELSSLVESTSTSIEATKSEAEAKLDEIQGMVVSAEIASNEVGTDLIAKHFEESAKNEKDAADFFRKFCIGAMIAAVITVLLIFFVFPPPESDWLSVVSRALLCGAVSILAAYCSRESTKHRVQHYDFLHAAISLRTLNPYIAPLLTEDKHKFILETGKKIFEPRNHIGIGADSFPLNLQEIVIEVIKKLEFPKSASAEATPSGAQRGNGAVQQEETTANTAGRQPIQ